MTTTTPTPGLFGHLAAGVLGGEAPDTVRFQRGKGYAYPPFQHRAQRYLTGASSLGKPVAKDWAFLERKRAADFAARHREELAAIPSIEAAKKFIEQGAAEMGKQAILTGRAVHEHTAWLDAGYDSPIDLAVRDGAEGMAAAWEAWKTKHQVRFGAIERTLFAPALGAAGTADRIAIAEAGPASWPTDRPFVVDIKTTSMPVGMIDLAIEYLVQGAVLASASEIAFEEGGGGPDCPRGPLSKPHTHELPAGVFHGFALVWVNPQGEHRTQWVASDEIPIILTLAGLLNEVKVTAKEVSAGAFGITTYSTPPQRGARKVTGTFNKSKPQSTSNKEA